LTNQTHKETRSQAIEKDKSIQVTFIYIALFAIQIISKQLCSDNRKLMQKDYFGCIAEQSHCPV